MDVAKHKHIVSELLTLCGENPEREGLINTPKRFLKAWDFLTQGYRQTTTEVVGEGIFKESAKDMVLVKNIEFYSLCEHHLLPFYGTCHVAYIPSGKIIGLSKIPRVVHMYARRLQVQERLGRQIAESLQEILQPSGVGVVMQAYHMCMMMRGVEKQQTSTMTSAMEGCFLELSTRQEFLSLIKD